MISKKGEVRRNWNKRFFVLKPKYLFYFKSEEDRKLKGVIHLSHCSTQRDHSETSKSFCLSINCRTRTYFLSFNSEAELAEWQQAIDRCIDSREEPNAALRSRMSTSQVNTEDIVDSRLKLIQDQIDTEKNYLQTLNLIQLYRFNIEKDSSLMAKMTMADVALIFSNINDIFAAHTLLLQSLQVIESRWPEKPVGAMILRMLPGLSIYNDYVTRFSQCLDTLKELQRSNPAFKTFLSTFQKKQSARHGLEILMQMPISRIGDFADFVSLFLASTPTDDPDYSNLNLALENARQLANQVDNANSVSSHMGTAIEITRKITGLPTEEGERLAQKHRRFLREGTVRLQGPGVGLEREDEFYVWLFNDLLVYAKKPAIIMSGSPYRYVGRIELCAIASVDPHPNGRPEALQLVPRPTTSEARALDPYSLILESGRDRMAWVTDLGLALVFTAQRRVFGMPLQSVMGQESQAGRDIPSFVQTCTEWIVAHGLQTEGIFRISGRKLEIQNVQNRLDQGMHVEFPPETEPHVVAGVLKLWFRELPEPLLTYGLYDEFLNAMMLENIEQRLPALIQGIKKLPVHNQNLLQHMIVFLSQVSQHEEINKMNSRNLSIVFAPTFLASENNLDPSALKQVYLVVEDLIAHYSSLFHEIEARRHRAAEAQRKRDAEAEAEKLSRQQRIQSILSASSDDASTSMGPLSAAAYADLPLKQGYLSKKGANRRNWTTRWFMAKKSCLLYYKSPQDINGMPKGKIPLSPQCILFPWAKKAFGFCIYAPEADRIYYICAKNDNEQTEWVEELSKIITFSAVPPSHLIKKLD